MSWTLHHNDVMAWARDYDGEPFHALLCDPPYHLTEGGRKWPRSDAGIGPYGRHTVGTKGFMGKDWDGGRLAFDPELWYALGQHLYPGAFGMAFASSRGWHRLAGAIEDAGFIIHPSIFGWSFGSGFPKATRIDVQVDRDAGAERAVVGPSQYASRKPNGSAGVASVGLSATAGHSLTAPATELAQAWQGHRYGLQALKPALEPIIVFQRPYEGRAVEYITATGAGALNIEGGRIGTSKDVPASPSNRGHVYGEYNGEIEMGVGGKDPNLGRWPSNLILIHTPACNGTCAPGCPVLAMDAQSGELSSGQMKAGTQRANLMGYGGALPAATLHDTYGDTGGASRFFYDASWALDVAEALDEADPVAYVAKASSRERNAGLELFNADTVDDGRQTPIDNAYQRGQTLRRNIHPTVKPIALARYLATLLLPPARYAPRRIVVPFAGSGSEMIGASLAGWDEVHGIERDAEYIPINEARNRFWAGWRPEDAQAAIEAWSVGHEAPAPAQPTQAAMPLVFGDAA